MTIETENTGAKYKQILVDWLASCTRGKKVAKNTVAIGIVVLDHLCRTVPVTRDEVVSKGGEIKGARSGLKKILLKYGLPGDYLKEATTRQSPQDGQRLFDALHWGEELATLEKSETDEILMGLIGVLVDLAKEQLKRENLRLDIDRRLAPTAWIKLIVDNARGRSGGVVEQHLVGAKLERRYHGIDIPNHPAHAADRQTEREGDFSISKMIYHVTATPGRSVIQKCAENIRAGKIPILLVPDDKARHAEVLALDEGIDKELIILSLEGFIALNIIELATEENKDFFAVLQEIIAIYNRRLLEVETDFSLQIEAR